MCNELHLKQATYSEEQSVSKVNIEIKATGVEVERTMETPQQQDELHQLIAILPTEEEGEVLKVLPRNFICYLLFSTCCIRYSF